MSSPFAPKHPRLVPGGPPLELSNDPISDAPGSLFGPEPADTDLIDNVDVECLEASLRRLKRQQDLNVAWPHSARRPLLALMVRRGLAIARGVFSILVAGFIAGAVAAPTAYLVARISSAQYNTTIEPKIAAVEPLAAMLSPARARQARLAEYQTAASGVRIPLTSESTSGEGLAPGRASAFLPDVANDETLMLASRSEAQPEPTASPP